MSRATDILRGAKKKVQAGLHKVGCTRCKSKLGLMHTPGCRNELCPFCGKQLISCGCWDKGMRSDTRGHLIKGKRDLAPIPVQWEDTYAYRDRQRSQKALQPHLFKAGKTEYRVARSEASGDYYVDVRKGLGWKQIAEGVGTVTGAQAVIKEHSGATGIQSISSGSTGLKGLVRMVQDSQSRSLKRVRVVSAQSGKRRPVKHKSTKPRLSR